MTVQSNDTLVILGILVLAMKKKSCNFLRLVSIKAVMLQHLPSLGETQSEARIDVRVRTLACLFSMQFISPQLEHLNIIAFLDFETLV